MTGGAEIVPESGVPPRHTILVAEDDAIILHTMAQGLADAGYDVSRAGDGEEAWRIFLERPADLALVDVRMPVMDGFALVRRLREFSDIPVIFLTAFDDQEFVADAAELGATSYLVKPVRLQQLLPIIRIGIQLQAMKQQLKDKVLNLEAALRSSREISVAIGVLRERMKVSEHQAYEFIRQKARHQRRPVDEIAHEIVASLG